MYRKPKRIHPELLQLIWIFTEIIKYKLKRKFIITNKQDQIKDLQWHQKHSVKIDQMNVT